jgi:hypothetical protein
LPTSPSNIMAVAVLLAFAQHHYIHALEAFGVGDAFDVADLGVSRGDGSGEPPVASQIAMSRRWRGRHADSVPYTGESPVLRKGELARGIRG